MCNHMAALSELPDVVEEDQGRDECERCTRPLAACWCPYLPNPPLDVSTNIIILQHPLEVKRALRTAPMIQLGLAPGKCTVYRGKKFPLASHTGLADLLRSPRTVILFPGPDAIDVADLASSSGGRPQQRSESHPEQQGGNRPPEQQGGSRPPEQQSGSRPPEQQGGSRPPEHRSESRPPEKQGGNCPEQQGSSRPPEQQGGSRPPEQQGASRPPEQQGSSRPPEKQGVNCPEQRSESRPPEQQGGGDGAGPGARLSGVGNESPSRERGTCYRQERSDVLPAVGNVSTPGEGSADSAVEGSGRTEPPYNVVLLDGTWRQAKTMYTMSPALHDIRQVMVTGRHCSSYVVRTQPTSACLSTLEAAAACLQLLERRPQLGPLLLQPLHALCRVQLAHGAVRHSSKQALIERGQYDRRPGVRTSRMFRQLGVVL